MKSSTIYLIFSLIVLGLCFAGGYIDGERQIKSTKELVRLEAENARLKRELRKCNSDSAVHKNCLKLGE